MQNFGAYVAKEAPRIIAKKIDALSEDQLLDGNTVEQLIQLGYRAVAVEPLPHDIDEMVRKAEFEPLPGDTIDIYLPLPDLDRWQRTLGFEPSNYTRVDVSFRDNSAVIRTPNSPDAAKKAVQAFAANLRQLNKDIESNKPRLLDASKAIVDDRVAKARGVRTARESRLAAIEATGIRRRGAPSQPMQESEAAQTSATPVAKTTKPRAIPDESHAAQADEILKDILSALKTIEDAGELGPEASALLSEHTIPMVLALKELLGGVPESTTELLNTRHGALVVGGRAIESVLLVGRVASGINGLRQIPSVLQDAGPRIEAILDWIPLI